MTRYSAETEVHLKDDVSVEITLSLQPKEFLYDYIAAQDYFSIVLLKAGKPMGPNFESFSNKVSVTVNTEKEVKMFGSPEGTFLKIGKAYISGDVDKMVADINAAIKSLYNQVETEAGELTEYTKSLAKEKKEQLKIHTEVIATAEAQGVDTLMTNEQRPSYLKSLNDIQNEGGEGYLPRLITIEDYNRSKEIVAKYQTKEGK